MATRRCNLAALSIAIAITALMPARHGMANSGDCSIFPKVHARKSISVAPERHKEFINFVEMNMSKEGYHRSSVHSETPDGHYDMIFQSPDARIGIIVEHNNDSRQFVARIQTCNRRDAWRPDWRAFLSVLRKFSRT